MAADIAARARHGFRVSRAGLEIHGAQAGVIRFRWPDDDEGVLDG